MLKIKNTIIIILMFITVGCAKQKINLNIDNNLELPNRFSITGKAKIDDKFWLSLKDPNLNKLIEYSLENNFSVKAAWNRYKQYMYLYKKTESVSKLKMDMSSSLSRSYSNSRNTDRSFNFGLSSSYELDFWGNIESSINAGLADFAGKKQELLTAQIILVSKIAENWVALILNRKQFMYINEKLTINKKILELIKKYSKNNIQYSVKQVYEREQIINNIEYELMSLENEKERLLNMLTVLTGNNDKIKNINISKEFPDINEIPNTGIPSEIIMNRPDVKTVYFSLVSANQKLKTAITSQWPRISLSASTFSFDNNPLKIFDNWLSSLSINLAMPLLNGKSLKNEVERSKLVYREKLNIYKEKILNSLSEIENAITGEKYAKLQLKKIREQIQKADELLKLSLLHYNNGSESYINYLNEHLQKINFEINEQRSVYAVCLSRISLYKSVAGGFEIINKDKK